MGQSNGRFFGVIMAAFCVALVVSNVIANKVVGIGPLAVSGASLIFPATYWLDDVLVEVYGYARARQVIWLAMGFQILATLAIMLALWLPGVIPPQDRAFHDALSLTPWIVVGSLVAYWLGEFANSYVLARLKVMTAGRWLFSRAWASTLVGQAIDSAVFASIAFGFGAHLPWPDVWHIAWSIYLVKCAVEVGLTPVTYAICSRLKRAEGVDALDTHTAFTPFAWQESA